MTKHQEHVVCVKASHFENRKDGFADYTLKSSHLMTGQRAELENDHDFRQVIPVAVFTHDGRIWAYRRTTTSGESRLVGKVTVAVGGHWDVDDIVSRDSIIDVQQSMVVALDREIVEEVKISSAVTGVFQLKRCICSDETEVDSVHIAVINMISLDGELIEPLEDKLESLGFMTPEELMSGDYDLDTWGRLIAELVVKAREKVG